MYTKESTERPSDIAMREKKEKKNQSHHWLKYFKKRINQK
jgi:hypothetical protein